MTKPRTRHIWVRPEFSPQEFPGLVLEWERKGEGGWHALVTYVDDEGRAVTTWLGSDRLRPVPSSPQIGSAYG